MIGLRFEGSAYGRGLYVLERRQDGEQENDGDEVMGTPKTMASMRRHRVTRDPSFNGR